MNPGAGGVHEAPAEDLSALIEFIPCKYQLILPLIFFDSQCKRTVSVESLAEAARATATRANNIMILPPLMAPRLYLSSIIFVNFNINVRF